MATRSSSNDRPGQPVSAATRQPRPPTRPAPRRATGGLSAEQRRRANKSDLEAARKTRMRTFTTQAAQEKRQAQIAAGRKPRGTTTSKRGRAAPRPTLPPGGSWRVPPAQPPRRA